jgi:hypothetical protein
MTGVNSSLFVDLDLRDGSISILFLDPDVNCDKGSLSAEVWLVNLLFPIAV